MPRYEYRVINPVPAAEKSFMDWIAQLDAEFANRDPEHRSNVVREALHQLYLGRPYATPGGGLAEESLVHSFDPRNATLEPEYYGDVDAAKYAERKPLIWFWMMYDRSPVGLNHWLGYRVRAMLARHVEKIKRVRYGPLTLDVPPGEFRQLTLKEVQRLKSATGGEKRSA